MIKGVLIVNNQGKPRVVKFYEHVPDAEQQAVIRDIYTQVSKRSDTLCNFLEGTVRYWGDGIKLIYRHYATLYFVFAVDKQESDLGILDIIHGTNNHMRLIRDTHVWLVFVETLDKCFENVCELDFIFHSDKVHYVLDEIVMGGMVLESNINEILTAVNEMNRLDSNSTKRSLPGMGKK
ncbi:hypothetical protein DYB37_012877 [Aphanomyces astaci]|uniref:AP complex subunit sigma n=2 Tax=Aphanomyces astaci TaxID=112090 RepID=A0A397BPA8_APHAT|nr:hypothetical protein DYB36_012111 [Aphanomyces astaci]RHY20059.1 hypothetical protein DYB25_011489 [Aphanomyces astaci]RHY42914.1 hypothetical protein DYB38_012113 [Aphanomyces astaci]RHY44821.1 hypothetical protein DYB30_012684 [Aphanomyces astaci]RHY88100.1 hypothetical protein DYB35_012734 [Aphanomyces astaci]